MIQLKKGLWYAIWFLLGVCTIMVSGLALHSESRIRLQAWLDSDKKELLATLSADLLGNGSQFKILKYGTSRGIIVEVLAPSENEAGAFQFIDRIFIPDPHDGFFSINTHATRLAIVDVDEDGQPEILAPSFDDKLVAHLNTLRLDPDTRRLELVRPKSSSE